MDLDQLRRDGYTVAEQVVDPALVNGVLAGVEEVSGVVLDDASSWPAVGGMLPIWGHQALWDVRQHPPVHAAFAAVCGTKELWVSMDRVSVKAPGGQALPIHWDVDPASD